MGVVQSYALTRVIIVVALLVALPPGQSAAGTLGTAGVVTPTAWLVLSGHTETWWKWWKPDPGPKPKGSVAIPATAIPLGIGLGGLALWRLLRRRSK